jgi:hypothetical protein
MCGAYDAPEVKGGLDYLARLPAQYGGESYFYAIYYAAQAMNQAGGAYYADWMPKMRSLLLANQGADGSWLAGPGDSQSAGAGPAFSTAIACLVLAVDCHYLPIYQR